MGRDDIRVWPLLACSKHGTGLARVLQKDLSIRCGFKGLAAQYSDDLLQCDDPFAPDMQVHARPFPLLAIVVWFGQDILRIGSQNLALANMEHLRPGNEVFP